MNTYSHFKLFGSLIVITSIFSTSLPAQQKWPHPVPARIADGSNKDLFIMTLGEIQTPLADGVFDPVRDEVKLRNGKVIPHYYRDAIAGMLPPQYKLTDLGPVVPRQFNFSRPLTVQAPRWYSAAYFFLFLILDS